MFFLKNLSSSEVHRGDPWDFTRLDLVPPRAITDKAARTAWMLLPSTEYHAYSMFEGTNPALRIKGPSGIEEGNPPIKCCGIAADYDLPLSDSEIETGVARMAIKPNWLERTLSGNARLLFLFESPISLPSYSFAVFLLKKIQDFLPLQQLAGLDVPALTAPERYFTNGAKWKALSATPVSGDLIRAFLIEVSKRFEWGAPEIGPTIPLDVAAAELKKKYPRFSEWGTFELGSQGTTFWVDGSTSPLSAIVRSSGIQTFAAHASKPFATWSELLGAEFVKQFRSKQTGAAVADIYFDEKTYFSRLLDGSWARDNLENLKLFLKTHKGLSDRVCKGETASELEQAIGYVHRNHRVRTAASFAFYREGMMMFNGVNCLNTHTIKAISPGETAEFPWLGNFLETLFDPPEQLPYFMSWLAHFYRSCYHRKPRSGHALFIAGGTDVGKTFLNRAVIGGLVGGFGEANDFLMGNDNFNEELFDKALWTIDDGSISTCSRSHKRFSEMVKKCVANPSFRLNGKFLKANTVPWQGRVVITLNIDGESLRLIPDLEISIQEKIMLLKTVSEAAVKFMDPDEMEAMLARELPGLARYLLNYTYPEHTLGKTPRFFVVPYREASLMRSSNLSSESGGFSEILAEFLKDYFGRETNADYWEGSALALYRQIVADGSMGSIMKRYEPQAIARQLMSLSAKKVFDISLDATNEHSRVFKIGRGAFPKKLNGHVVPQAVGSNFERSI